MVADGVFNESISTIFVDLISIYEVKTDGTIDKANAVHMNNCGESLAYDDDDEDMFGLVTYMPVNFELTMPDTTSVNEQTGSLNISGVTSEYIAKLQQAKGTLYLRDALIKLSDVEEAGEYIIDPVDIEIASITISSSTASIAITLKSGGILNFYASRYSYTVGTFPGISG